MENMKDKDLLKKIKELEDKVSELQRTPFTIIPSIPYNPCHGGCSCRFCGKCGSCCRCPQVSQPYQITCGGTSYVASC